MSGRIVKLELLDLLLKPNAIEIQQIIFNVFVKPPLIIPLIKAN